jgi:hypothetical protein
MPASGLKLRHRLASTDRQYRTHRTDNQKSDILQRLTVEGLQILFWAPSPAPAGFFIFQNYIKYSQLSRFRCLSCPAERDGILWDPVGLVT